jgi:hypothetical protein
MSDRSFLLDCLHSSMDAVQNLEAILPPLPASMSVLLPAGHHGKWLATVSPSGHVEVQAYNSPRETPHDWRPEMDAFKRVAARLWAVKAI